MALGNNLPRNSCFFRANCLHTGISAQATTSRDMFWRGKLYGTLSTPITFDPREKPGWVEIPSAGSGEIRSLPLCKWGAPWAPPPPTSRWDSPLLTGQRAARRAAPVPAGQGPHTEPELAQPPLRRLSAPGGRAAAVRVQGEGPGARNEEEGAGETVHGGRRPLPGAAWTSRLSTTPPGAAAVSGPLTGGMMSE